MFVWMRLEVASFYLGHLGIHLLCVNGEMGRVYVREHIKKKSLQQKVLTESAS